MTVYDGKPPMAELGLRTSQSGHRVSQSDLGTSKQLSCLSSPIGRVVGNIEALDQIVIHTHELVVIDRASLFPILELQIPMLINGDI